MTYGVALSAMLSLKSMVMAETLVGDEFFKVETLATGLVDAMEMAPLPNGDVFITERTGALKLFVAKTGKVELIKKFDVSLKRGGLSRETGLLGITIDPDFSRNGWFYVYYSPKSPEVHRLSRFTFRNGKASDEKKMLEVEQSREEGVCHEGGSLAFDGEGNLFLSTGDNTNPFAAKGTAPIDERKGNEHQNAQRSAGNTNDLRGAVLRIKPTRDGGYTIPRGNLFPKGKAKTRPEIFVKGCRNPWRIGVDKRNNNLYWGDVGPDARKDDKRGPMGYCEINQAKEAGYYGWPYFLADNKPYTQYDFEEKKLGKKFNPAAPENDSRLNTGLKTLPPAQEPLWFEKRACFCAGPVYYYDDYSNSTERLPKELDGCLITFNWNNGQMQLTKLDRNGKVKGKYDFLKTKKFIHTSDVEMGVDGTMYILEYGKGWYNNKNGALKRVTYSREGKQFTKEDKLDSRLEGLDPDHTGTIILSKSLCLSCHMSKEKSIGPSYQEVADRYRNDKKAVDKLTEKIVKGGSGAWGNVPMPPNTQYNEEELSQIVDVILSLPAEGHQE